MCYGSACRDSLQQLLSLSMTAIDQVMMPRVLAATCRHLANGLTSPTVSPSFYRLDRHAREREQPISSQWRMPATTDGCSAAITVMLTAARRAPAAETTGPRGSCNTDASCVVSYAHQHHHLHFCCWSAGTRERALERFSR